MSKKIKDENGKTYVLAKPWYKKWSTFILTLGVISFVAIVYSLSGTGKTEAESKANMNNTTALSKKTAQAAQKVVDKAIKSDRKDSSKKANPKQLKLKFTTIDINSEKTYKTNFVDSTWAKTKMKIDKVRVVKAKNYTATSNNKEVKIEGVLLVHFVIDAGRDFTFYPSQSTLVTNDGQQSDAALFNSDNLDGEILKGAHRSGNIVFKLKKLKQVESLKKIRLKWRAYLDSKDYLNADFTKHYDATIQLIK